VASVARGIEGWPRSSARQGMAARLGATAVSRHVAERLSRRARRRQARRDGGGEGQRACGACALERGGSQRRGQAAGAASSAAAQRAHVRARLSACARREGRESEGEREEREREWREKRKVNGLTQFKLKIFN